MRNNKNTAARDLVRPEAKKFRARSHTAYASRIRSSRPIDGTGCGLPRLGMRR